MEKQTCQWTADGKICKYLHPEIDGWVLTTSGTKARKEAKPAKGKGKGKGGKGKKMCAFYAAGTCAYGDNCNKSHDTPTITPPKASAEKPKPKAKAKAKAAAEASSRFSSRGGSKPSGHCKLG